MRVSYRNPKELATAVKDAIDTYLEDLMSYEDLEKKILKMIEVNEERLVKNGNVDRKVSLVLGEDRVEIINKIIKDNEK
ncbi:MULTISPECIES: TIGR04540 family protein [Clostridium]|uniref:TIGR04540 family protein n=1 Tax=Clostridium TaxID=1485 RepID=UPI0006654607|nr:MULTISPECIES: TIGR04540 family protein [Clostridium]MBS7132677.1 TIGR04540 family protein [Clostridium sp.]MDB2076699.1 TIGR04540 family protein [Clostridium paraputrificum]MDB2080603.1 TIGR04540 family protein [Clostridium paraputrificum]MDB2087344.1 TIGR04540 family protein [Clostridium paraputrificum]MDB2092929.1 TIGR04540 family protein [Clostridium paraputrificum]